MKFQGDIASIPIADVAQNLSANRKGGLLTIRRGTEMRQMVFRDGKVVSYSDNVGFSVPRWFADKGVADPSAIRKAALKAQRSRRKTLGEFLEEAGALKATEYRSHLKALFQEMLYEIFSFRQGTFEFQEGPPPSEAVDHDLTVANLELAVGPVLIEAARRLDDWEAIRKSLPSEDDIYRVAPSEKQGALMEVEGNELAKRGIELLDGTRSIREVISLLPTSRFEASRIIADLVTKKRARPVAGAEIMAALGGLTSSEDRGRALVLFKAALEREPGNREVLQKVAELSLELGKKEESAVYYKLLAHTLLGDGDRQGAQRALRRSMELNSKDIGVWQKLYDLLAEGQDHSSLHAFGLEMARNLRSLNLGELARDHLARMLERFPENAALRFQHAEVLLALGDRVGAVEDLLTLARDLLKRGLNNEAERALAKLLEYDRENKRAREIYEKLRSGKMSRQRARRRLIVRVSTVVFLGVGVLAFLGYDLAVRREFSIVTRQVFAEGLIEKGEYWHALERLRDLERRHPLSLLRFFEGRALTESLREAAQRKSGPGAGGPRASGGGSADPREAAGASKRPVGKVEGKKKPGSSMSGRK